MELFSSPCPLFQHLVVPYTVALYLCFLLLKLFIDSWAASTNCTRFSSDAGMNGWAERGMRECVDEKKNIIIILFALDNYKIKHIYLKTINLCI